MMIKTPKQILLNRMQKKGVSEDKIRLILEELIPLEERRWEVVRSDVRLRTSGIQDIFILLSRNKKEPILLSSSVSSGPFIQRRRIEHPTVDYIDAFYQQRSSMPLHIFTYSFSTDLEVEAPRERFTDRWRYLSGQTWLDSYHHTANEEKDVPLELVDLSSWTHPDFDEHVRKMAAACYEEWYGPNTGTLQWRIYLEHENPPETGNITDLLQAFEDEENTPKLVIDIGGSDPAVHPVITLHFDLWSGHYGDHTWDTHQLWNEFQKFVPS